MLDIASDMGIVEKSGSWFAYGGNKIGQGKENARNYLVNNPDVMEEIVSKIKAATFGENNE